MASLSGRHAVAVSEMRLRDGPGGDEECGLGTGREQPGHGCRSLDRDKEDLGIRMPEVRRSRALRAAVTKSPFKSPFHPCTGGRPQVDHTRRGRIVPEAASGEAFRRLPAQLSLSNFLSQTAQTESLDWTGGDFTSCIKNGSLRSRSLWIHTTFGRIRSKMLRILSLRATVRSTVAGGRTLKSLPD